MEFNLVMCDVMHFVKINQDRTHIVNDSTLGSVVELGGLGVHSS